LESDAGDHLASMQRQLCATRICQVYQHYVHHNPTVKEEKKGVTRMAYGLQKCVT